MINPISDSDLRKLEDNFKDFRYDFVELDPTPLNY